METDRCYDTLPSKKDVSKCYRPIFVNKYANFTSTHAHKVWKGHTLKNYFNNMEKCLRL